MENIEKLINEFKINSKFDNHSAALITSRINRLYFSEFNSSAGVMLVTHDASYLIVDFRYYEAAKSLVRGIEVLMFEDLSKTLFSLFKKHNIKSVFFERQGITLSEFLRLEKICISNDTKCYSDELLDKSIYKLRSIKSCEEINKIKEAQKITDFAFEYILKRIKKGITEKEIALDIEFFIRKNIDSGIAFDLIVLFGKNTSLPHGIPGDNKLKDGDFILIDMGATYKGYCSDMTRTVALRNVSEEQKNIYNTALEAQTKAIDKIRASTKCSEVDKTARDIIYNVGYEGCFGHATGHSVGLEVHEEPRFSKSDETLLLPGMIMTVEPGIYIEGKFGVRIEDMVIVNENSYENITSSKKELIIL